MCSIPRLRSLECVFRVARGLALNVMWPTRGALRPETSRTVLYVLPFVLYMLLRAGSPTMPCMRVLKNWLFSGTVGFYPL